MSPNELGFTLVLIAVLLGVSTFFGRQQVQLLRGLRAPGTLEPDEQRYLLSRAYRRLLCSALMVVIAGFLVGWLFLEPVQRELAERDRTAPMTDGQKNIVQLLSFYWIGALLVLLALLALAATDFWATARYWLSQHRKILADRRAMLEQQTARLRQERNGQRGPSSN